MEIRPFRADDLAAIHSINEAEVPAVGSVTPEALRAIADESIIALVACGQPTADSAAEAGGVTTAGFCLVLGPGAEYGSLNYRWFADRYVDFIYLDRVAVAPAFRGQGVGRMLYAEVERLAATVRPGATDFTLEVNVRPRNDASLAFHDRLGFVEVAQRDTDYDTTVSMMTKPLG